MQETVVPAHSLRTGNSFSTEENTQVFRLASESITRGSLTQVTNSVFCYHSLTGIARGASVEAMDKHHVMSFEDK